MMDSEVSEEELNRKVLPKQEDKTANTGFGMGLGLLFGMPFNMKEGRLFHAEH